MNIDSQETYYEQLEKENKRLKKILNGYKTFGTDGCKSCDQGRVTIFVWNDECIFCNPESYKDIK